MEPNNDTTKETSPDQPPQRKSTAATFALLFGLLALLIALLSGALTLTADKKLKKRLNQTRIELNSKQIITTLETVKTQLEQTQQKLLQTQDNLQALAQRQNRSPQGWTIAEAAYLAQLAQYNLSFEKRPILAKKLLEAADAKLASVSDARTQAARQAVADDIAKLNAIKPLDLTGLMTTLIALDTQVAQLPQFTQPTTKPTQPASTMATQQSSWKKGLERSMNWLHGMVVIRHHDQPVSPLLNPTQRLLVSENIRLALTQARWAALNHDAALFQTSLDQAHAKIEAFYNAKQPATEAILTNIQQLKTLNVAPTLPTVNASINAIKQLLNTLSQPPTRTTPNSINQEVYSS